MQCTVKSINKKWVSAILLAAGLCALEANAAYKDTIGVKVKLISSYVTNNGNVLVQTDPKPDISGLNCTDDYWLVLAKGDPGFEGALSMLLAAYSTQTNLIVRAEENTGTTFCTLSRVTLTAD